VKEFPWRGHSASSAGFEVVNAGVVGAGTLEECRLLRRITTEAHCQRALFVFIPNDIPLTSALERRQHYINDLIVFRKDYFDSARRPGLFSGWLRSFSVPAQMLALRRIEKETIQWYLDSYSPQHNGRHLAVLQRRMSELASIEKCQVAFILYPLMLGVESEYPLQSVHDQVAGMAKTAGLPVLDLAKVFDGVATESLWVHPSDHHPNGKAHRMAADAILRWLHADVPGFLDNDSSRDRN